MWRASSKYLIVIGLLLLALVVYMLTTQRKSASRPVTDAVPVDAAFFYESNQTGPLWKKIVGETTFWPVLKKIDRIQAVEQQLAWLDSLLAEKPDVPTFMHQQPMALALCKAADGYGFLFVAAVGNSLKPYEIEGFANVVFKGRINMIERNILGVTSFLLVDARNNLQYGFALVDGLLVGSFDKEILDKSINQLLSKEKITDIPSFQKVKNTTGTKVDGYVYINQRFFADFVSDFSTDSQKQPVQKFLQAFGGWSALDLLVKQQDIVLNGYTDPDTNTYLAQLMNSKPLKNTIINVLPYSTRMLLHMSRNDLHDWWPASGFSNKSKSLEQSANINFNENFIGALSGELALASSSNQQGFVFVAGVSDQQKLMRFFGHLESRFGVIAKEKVENENIKKINLEALVPSVFGDVFSAVNACAYVVVDQYLLIANDLATLEDVLRYYRSGRTLDMNENFKSFQNNLSSSASITLYVNLREGNNLISNLVDPKLVYQLKRNTQVISEFEGLAVQLTTMNGLLYTTAYLKHNPNYKEESLVAWKLTLDAPMTGKPHIVEDHTTGMYDVIVFDADRNMYLIGADGNIIWKKRLSEEPVGDVHVVDYYKNGKYQYLFNTPNYLQLIDRNGNNVANYPIKLRSQATNGISVFDYNNQRDYRILVSCADKLTYNYELRGKEVDGWQKPRSLEIVTKPAERLIAAGKDYILITDIKGNIRIVDRRGQIRISPRGTLEKSIHADFYVNRTNSKGILLTSDKEGKLLYVSANGQLSTTNFGTYSPEHFFLYDDFDQNGSVDFIYLDGTKLRIFDRFKKDLFTYSFRNVIVTKPLFFNVTKRKRLLGIVSESAREIYLIDKNGKMTISAGLAGETPFAVGSLHDNDEINLIAGLGATLYNYLIY